MDRVPVRYRDRWIDDGLPVELWSDDGVTGLRLNVAATSDTPPLAIMEVRRIGAEPASATVFVDFSTGELRHLHAPAEVFVPPLDLAWLRGKLDGGLLRALRHRLERLVRAGDLYDWHDGDRPRVALGEHATFAQVLPAAWDLVTAFRGRRYALIDSYRIAADADEKPIAIEIVDLTAGEAVGHAEIRAGSDPSRGPGRSWRSSGPIADPLLSELRQDADRWFELVARAETIARIARMMKRWDRDVRDPAAAVRQLLADGHDDEVVVDRVRSLGARCAPALETALVHEDRSVGVTAARTLAELGSAAGLPQLVAALEDDAGEDAWQIVDAIACLGERAVDALLEALAGVSDRVVQDRLLDALTAIDADDSRICDLLVELVRADPGRAGLLREYGRADPVVVELLTGLARGRMTALEADLGDDDAFDEAAEVIDALRGLGVEAPEIRQFELLVERRSEARIAAIRASRPAARVMPEPRPLAPVQAVPRPGRNEPCWCGSSRKYKKCHLDADDEAARPR